MHRLKQWISHGFLSVHFHLNKKLKSSDEEVCIQEAVAAVLYEEFTKHFSPINQPGQRRYSSWNKLSILGA